MCDRVEYQKLAILVTQEWDRVKLYFPLSNDINFSNLQVLKLSFNYVMLSEVKIIVRILLKYSWKEFKELYINKNNHSINKAICKYCKNIKIINTELTIEALSELDYFFDALPFLESVKICCKGCTEKNHIPILGELGENFLFYILSLTARVLSKVWRLPSIRSHFSFREVIIHQ
ncbi:hypothetical protein RclHR1_08460006 [Rhizophagus clarus]|uniref:Uncharacterized protein n=1 Tax=Rhizophagus clarus TaxID=94130 RepID=A0A2Z6SNH4_9GLOM|nr:hypothetical protein RclHR1_08460006 [Rhizophagus clarus]